MGKRKRGAATEQNEDHHKKHKKARRTHHERAQSTVEKSQGGVNVTTQSSAAGEIDLQESVAQAIRALQPPSGLKKRQRKRWRHLAESAAAKLIADKMEPSPRNAQSDPTPVPSEATAKLKPTVDRALLQQLSLTKLPPKPVKRWHDDASQQDLAASKGLAPETTAGVGSLKGQTISDEVKRSTPIESSAASEAVDIPSLATSPHASARTATKIDPPQPIYAPIASHVGGSHSDSYSPRNVPMTMSYRRHSFGKKATHIPAVPENPDVVESFRRFTAFLRGRNVDSSDDDSDGSSDDSESDTNPAVPVKEHDGAQLAYPAPETNEVVPFEGHDEDDQAAPSSQTLQHEDLEVANAHSIPSDEAYWADEQDYLIPSFAQITSDPATAMSPSRLANIRIKRQATNPGSVEYFRPGGKEQSQSSPTLPVLDDSDDDSQAVLRTVDEIARNVFASTRPLPASKPSVSVDPEREDLENRLMTFASSDIRRVTRSMSTPKTTLGRRDHAEMPIPQTSHIICNSVLVGDVQQPPAASAQPIISKAAEESSSIDSENVDVAMIKQPSKENSPSFPSELSRSPSPPPVADRASEAVVEKPKDQSPEMADVHPKEEQQGATPSRKKRKMTGRTSKHFTAETGQSRRRTSARIKAQGEEETSGEPLLQEVGEPPQEEEIVTPIKPESTPRVTRSSTKQKRKGTGKKSSYFTPSKPPLDPDIIDRVDFYNSTGKKKRVPAGTSIAPVPPISSARFGIIQEKLWREPFWLLIAVTFLNKTTGRAAAPVFWDLKKRYVTPEALADAEVTDLHKMIWHLGLQRQRSKRLIEIARAWIAEPPAKGKRWRTLHYPLQGDGKEHKKDVMVEEDAEDCDGALEIGHLPGCGPYAWDSWRIFCRDVLRGVAEDYDGKGAGVADFVPEWRKVLPLDKELRACLRWMWLREGWIWDCLSGERRRATEEEMEMAVRGEMEIDDEQERKFAAQAAGVENAMDAGSGVSMDQAVLSPSPGGVKRAESEALPELPESKVDDGNGASDNIVVSSSVRKGVRRSARFST